MSINSRKKGQRGEKKALKVFEEWTGMEFSRTPASGGLRWKKTDNITGDIICTDALHRFNFAIEVKNYRDINFQHLIIPEVHSDIRDEFWIQALHDAKRGKKLPMLLMRYNGLKPSNLFFLVLRYKDFKRFKPLVPKITSSSYLKVGTMIIIRSTDFFASNYKEINELAKRLIKQEYGS